MPTSKIASDKRSSSTTLLLVAVAVILGVIGYIGFRWTWGLMMLANVDSAIGRMRVLSDAEAKVAHAHPRAGYTCVLSELPRSGEVQRLLTGDGTDNGYAFEIAGRQAPDTVRPNLTYYTTARPLHSGQPAFCSDQSGILKADYGGSVEKCRANGAPL